jgi:hypothetical protein
VKQLKADREEVGYTNELKFSTLNHSGKGEKDELARRWMSHIVEEADSPQWRIYFSITGVNNSKTGFLFVLEKIVPQRGNTLRFTTDSFGRLFRGC